MRDRTNTGRIYSYETLENRGQSHLVEVSEHLVHGWKFLQACWNFYMRKHTNIRVVTSAFTLGKFAGHTKVYGNPWAGLPFGDCGIEHLKWTGAVW